MSLHNEFVFNMRDSKVHVGSAWEITNTSQCLEKPIIGIRANYFSVLFLAFLLCLVFSLIGFALGLILRIKFYSSQIPLTLFVYLL